MILGTFALASDTNRAKSAAVWTAALVLCAVLGAALGTKLWAIAFVAPFAAAAAYVVDRRRRLAAVPTGVITLEDGVLAFLRGDRTIHRLKLDEARVSGRALKVGNERARIQVVIEFEDRAIVGKLSVPYKAADADEEGALPTTIELDRQGSRAFDALSYGKLR
ncbi:MAG: hypothetical protein ACXWP4_09590 [Polyangiales bacterium]